MIYRIVNDNYTRSSETDDNDIANSIKASVIRNMLNILEVNYFGCLNPVIEFTSQDASEMLYTYTLHWVGCDRVGLQM